MADKELTPRKEGEVEPSREREHPFYSLQRRMNEMFEDFWRGLPMPSFEWPGGGRFLPKVNVEDDGKVIASTPSCPGWRRRTSR